MSAPPCFEPRATLVLEAIVDRLVPADADPGACAAGALDYVIRHCEAHGEARQALAAGLEHLDRLAAQRSGCGFAELPEAAREALLAELEREPAGGGSRGFFERVLALTMEGFYTNPEGGGNRGAVSWKMLGYDPRRPRQRAES